MNKREIKKLARELIASVESTDWEEYISINDFMDSECVFLGTVFSLCPSGKYYMPFACSNVEPCNHCHGEGCDFCGWQGSREAYEDTLFYEYLESYAGKIGAWVENGEGDPCDIFLVREKE